MAQSARMCSSHDGSDECYVWVQKHGLLLTKTELATTTADCATFQQKTHRSWAPNIAPSLKHHQLLDGKLITLTPFYYGSGSNLSWLESTHSPGLGLPFPFAGSQSAPLCECLQSVWPTTKDPAQHCVRPKKLFYSNRGAGVSTWPCDALVPSQPMPSRSCRMTDGTIFWRCNRGCSFERKPYEHHPPVSVYSINPWPLNGDVFPQ